MKNVFNLVLLLLFLNISCEKPDFSDESDVNSDIIHTEKKLNKNYYQLKKKFATALHEAMLENLQLRQFLKTEALKRFNGDYDILYNYVRDSRVGESTFREILESYYKNKSDLAEIESSVPSLTIFIPSLPEESFSAESWNVAEEVPMVAIRLVDNDKTALISSNSDSYLLDNKIIPGFPVVVVKENERVVVPSYPQYNSLNTREYSANNGFSFKFSHSIFNFIFPPIEIVIDGTPDYLVDAWEVYGESQNLGWHRDYIYYTLQPNNVNGPYINDYSEFIRWFKIEGDGGQALDAIAGTPPTGVSGLDDPQLTPVLYNPSNFNLSSFWTDGSFEFDVNTVYDKDQPQLGKGFPANPEDLFDIEYDTWSFLWMNFYFVTELDTKLYLLDLEIQPWQLHNYSNEWTMEFQEVDNTQEVTNQESYTTKYNTNFGFESGELFKFGLELGGSAEVTESDTKTRKMKLESNDLDETTVRFGDNMIISEHSLELPTTIPINLKWYGLRRYTTGKVSFSLISLKVQ